MIGWLAFLLALPACAQTIRVSVMGLFRPTEFTLKPQHAVRLDAGGESLMLHPGQAAGFRVQGDVVDCFAQRRTRSARLMRITAPDGGPADFRLSTSSRLERRYHGALEIRARLGVLEAIVIIDRELAIASAVAAESPHAPTEARKALAVVARSYYVASGPRHDGYDFCDTTHCIHLREPPPPMDEAEETRGLILTYEGKPVEALFSASCGGRTRTLAEIGLRPGGGYPYVAVDCDACRRNARQWNLRLEGDLGERVLNGNNFESIRLDLGRSLGWSAMPSNNYTATREGKVVVLHGRGAGHGAGLCQQGAAAMAAEGIGFRAILSYYFPKTTLER